MEKKKKNVERLKLEASMENFSARGRGGRKMADIYFTYGRSTILNGYFNN